MTVSTAEGNLVIDLAVDTSALMTVLVKLGEIGQGRHREFLDQLSRVNPHSQPTSLSPDIVHPSYWDYKARYHLAPTNLCEYNGISAI